MGNSDSKVLNGENALLGGSQIMGGNAAPVSEVEDERKSPVRMNGKTRSGASTERSEDSLEPVNTKITDDQIQVNLAMADLMAYLQVVANNSNHLPLTRRDDPELDRTVSTLTSEEYARKSTAFLPADIRVIGATFTRYGRVWDLPTSEEYNAIDGALEPGRSYGGACCNTLLKVLYDSANDAAGAAQSEAAAQSLFEDDEDEEEEEGALQAKSFRSGFSLDYGGHASVSLTWIDLLRQMKAEFKEIGYAQMPKVTTSRKMDLSKTFSLIPEEFDATKNKKRSLLIGCNYKDLPDAELKASHDDIRSMKDYIVNVHNFPENKDEMTILLDDGDHQPPTFMNIIDAFKALSEVSQPGDVVFVQFSGHGGRVLDASNDEEAESYDEVIVPSDYKTAGLIRDTLMFKTLMAPMRFGVTVTIMIDCCDNGMVLELPYSWSTMQDRKDSTAKLSMNDDFSFVRFLKVVKTLYESSTFTQLGKTVGSALGPLASPIENVELASRKDKENNPVEHESQLAEAPGAATIFDALARACSPTPDGDGRFPGTDSAEDEKKDELSPQMGESLFEKVMNCTLLAPQDEDSDEDTFKTKTYDDVSYGDSYSEYDSATDDDSRRRSSSRRRRRR